MADIVIGRKQTFPITGALTLTPAQSGSVMVVSKAAAYTITLPAPSLASMGCEYTFFGGATVANEVKIDTGAANRAYGTISQDGDNVEITGGRTVSFAGGSDRGDYIHCVCDGTVWYFVCQS